MVTFSNGPRSAPCSPSQLSYPLLMAAQNLQGVKWGLGWDAGQRAVRPGFQGMGPGHSSVLCGHNLKEQLRTSQPHLQGLTSQSSFYLNSFQSRFGKEVPSIRGDWNAKVESQERYLE